MCCPNYLAIWTLDPKVAEPDFVGILLFSQIWTHFLGQTISFRTRFSWESYSFLKFVLFSSLDPICRPNIVATPFQPLFATGVHFVTLQLFSRNPIFTISTSLEPILGVGNRKCTICCNFLHHTILNTMFVDIYRYNSLPIINRAKHVFCP